MEIRFQSPIKSYKGLGLPSVGQVVFVGYETNNWKIVRSGNDAMQRQLLMYLNIKFNECRKAGVKNEEFQYDHRTEIKGYHFDSSEEKNDCVGIDVREKPGGFNRVALQLCNALYLKRYNAEINLRDEIVKKDSSPISFADVHMIGMNGNELSSKGSAFRNGQAQFIEQSAHSIFNYMAISGVDFERLIFVMCLGKKKNNQIIFPAYLDSFADLIQNLMPKSQIIRNFKHLSRTSWAMSADALASEFQTGDGERIAKLIHDWRTS